MEARGKTVSLFSSSFLLNATAEFAATTSAERMFHLGATEAARLSAYAVGT